MCVSVLLEVIEDRVPLALGSGVCESRRFSQPSFVVWFSWKLECDADEAYRERTPPLLLWTSAEIKSGVH